MAHHFVFQISLQLQLFFIERIFFSNMSCSRYMDDEWEDIINLGQSRCVCHKPH